jgi:anion-transporting  ArsA/GET3 family ATPase
MSLHAQPALLDLEALLARRMVVVTGKGGVGKTTVATALALLAARRGKRVLLAQFESTVDAGQLLRSGPGPGPMATDMAEVEPGLSVVNMTPRSALREYGLLIFRFRAIVKAVLENRTVRHFLRAIPGLDDYAMLGKAWYHTTEVERGQSRFDLVVVDAPPTGQMLKVFGVPGVIQRSVSDSMLTRDATTIQGFLTNPQRCQTVIVTLAEELPMSETLELEKGVRELGMDVAGVVVNALYPVSRNVAMMEEVQAALAQTSIHQANLVEEARIFHRRRAINEAHLERLARSSQAPTLELPLLFTDGLGRAQLNELVAVLDASGG